MATQLDVFSALAANKYDHMIESSSDSSPCIQHDVPVSPRLLSKASKPGPGSPLSSSPSLSPLPAGGSSTRSIGSKRDRSSLWSDDEEAYSDFELDRKRVKSRSPSTPLNHHLRLPRWGEAFGELHDDPGITFADKTQRIPELPDKYQYLLLRPPQFGKSLFLSALYHYYDIHEAKHFSRRFGFLPVVTESPDLAPRHNQHLCLSFDLSHIVISSDIGLLKLRLSSKLYCPLGNFVDRYATELGLSSPASFCTGDGADMVAKVFKLVKARGHTLFVGVDNYDWPVQSCSFDRVSTLAHESLVSVQDVQCLVNTHFWSPLLAESGDIDKLFVTGALLVNYPALEHLQPCTAPSLQLSCGFTEQEVTTLAQAVLGETPGGILELQRSNGGYMFSSDGDLAQTLLHPQQTITWISKLSSGSAPRALRRTGHCLYHDSH
ncbi:hypothetical protein B0H15DRAFT_179269 [Mycena belliarum]|uniref:AAA-ATPase-like domain-containing protein n=1 Tax=Mycena belliarum TaxID=1033014 RepID=A0AAD6XNP4_9AGAR|nr:hypothetical protein B0H15DRAFT_179269 [Mycena belliae]